MAGVERTGIDRVTSRRRRASEAAGGSASGSVTALPPLLGECLLRVRTLRGVDALPSWAVGDD
jgi:hypothetical protein